MARRALRPSFVVTFALGAVPDVHDGGPDVHDGGADGEDKDGGHD